MTDRSVRENSLWSLPAQNANLKAGMAFWQFPTANCFKFCAPWGYGITHRDNYTRFNGHFRFAIAPCVSAHIALICVGTGGSRSNAVSNKLCLGTLDRRFAWAHWTEGACVCMDDSCGWQSVGWLSDILTIAMHTPTFCWHCSMTRYSCQVTKALMGTMPIDQSSFGYCLIINKSLSLALNLPAPNWVNPKSQEWSIQNWCVMMCDAWLGHEWHFHVMMCGRKASPSESSEEVEKPSRTLYIHFST